MGKKKRRKPNRPVQNKLTDDEWSFCLYSFDYRCCICGSIEKIQSDHWIPYCRGGSSYTDNIVPMCKRCNIQKGASPALGWLIHKYKCIAKAREIVARVDNYFATVQDIKHEQQATSDPS